MRLIYLHGFASGPSSSKAQVFKQRFAGRGVEMEIPDLADGDFENMTISSQLAVLERQARGEPVLLMGSSMGGYLAALYASLHPEVEKLVLLAPAFHFPHRWNSPECEQAGYIEVFHYAESRQRRISYDIVRDAALHSPEPSFPQPALIFHGTAADVVPPEYSVNYASRHPNVKLHLLASDHQLTDAVDEIWEKSAPFLLG